jgi:hypothetical protein
MRVSIAGHDCSGAADAQRWIFYFFFPGLPLPHPIPTNIAGASHPLQRSRHTKSLAHRVGHDWGYLQLDGLLDSTPFTPPFTLTKPHWDAAPRQFRQIAVRRQNMASSSPPIAEALVPSTPVTEASVVHWARSGAAVSACMDVNSVLFGPPAAPRPARRKNDQKTSKPMKPLATARLLGAVALLRSRGPRADRRHAA